jgi:membrane peptidoglycan carboxypeptidase
VQKTWRRAGAMYGAIGQIVLLTIVAGLLAAGITLPAVAITGLATRDAANTFDRLPVGTLGDPPAISTMYDIEGRPIANFYPGNIYRVPVSYDQIAPVMRDAIVAIEDSSFYSQGALDPRGTARALLSNSSSSQLQGASTLAQQYVKNVRILQAGANPQAVAQASDRSLSRKITQLRIAATVEHSMTQQQLLAAYLNVAFFGEQAYGIQVAAERYFSVPASQLTLTEAADLAGIVQSPSEFDPAYPFDTAYHLAQSKSRRNEVLNRMWQLHYITRAQATAAEQAPIVLKMSAAPLQTECSSPLAANSAYFCDYVEHVLVNDYPAVWEQMIKGNGGLKIYTTLNMRDQIAADNAVNLVEPRWSNTYNPGRNADTEVLIQPGTGAVRAIAINRKYGNGPGENSIDFAVNADYGGDPNGVQTGSSSKIFTLITALKQGPPVGAFGHTIKVVSPSVVGPYYDCRGGLAGGGAGVPPGYFSVVNAEGNTGKAGEILPLYYATVGSINVYFANLEKQVGLCNVVKTAADMGMTRADGKSLLKGDVIQGRYQYPADSIPSFTLGSVGVSPMSMAAAYASVAARGWYCAPNAITKIVTGTGAQVKLLPNSCHRDMTKAVADAANYILQGVLVSGTAAGREIGRPAAAKTGTANGGYYAAFAGYTPTLAGYVSVFNPYNPTTGGAMVGTRASWDQFKYGVWSGLGIDSQMYGDDAPGATWEYTFVHAQLGAPIPFVSPSLLFFSEGPGTTPKQVPTKKKHGGGPPPVHPTPPPPAH